MLLLAESFASKVWRQNNVEIKVVTNILAANQTIADENRSFFREKRVTVINLMGSPGAGKTTLLEETIGKLRNDLNIAVIAGDIATTKDAERIQNYGIPISQINTGGACHLDANMVRNTLPNYDFDEIDLLFIENVGNLVCPAEFDVGETAKVTILSVTEGDDKPLKYPLIFRESKVLVINKTDLLPYVDFNLERAREDILNINSDLNILEISCRTGEGLDKWLDWLILLCAGGPFVADAKYNAWSR
jgi:hydrogenase nickel incorporation protein HypB